MPTRVVRGYRDLWSRLPWLHCVPGRGHGAQAGNCTGSTIPRYEDRRSGKGHLTAAMSITLLPSRAGLGLIVVAARQFGVHICSADFTVIAGKRSTPP